MTQLRLRLNLGGKIAQINNCTSFKHSELGLLWLKI